MIIIIVTFLTALALSVIAAYFSVIGLMAIFAAASIPIAVMGAALEAAKVVAASWVYRNWKTAPRILKYYLVASVVVLSLITSMGIFGYLSKAHLDQSLPSNDVMAKVAVLDEKLNVEKDTVETNRKALKQMDEAVDQIMARSEDSRGAERAVSLRRSQQKERVRLLQEIDSSNKQIKILNAEKAPIAAELRKLEVEVGPLKYIAALFYGDNPDTNALERAVRWVIITLIFVFDPLAILLLISANMSLVQYKEKDKKLRPDSSGTFSDFSNLKDTWDPSLKQETVTDDDTVKVEKTKIHEIPKEIMDKVFRR